MIFLVDFFFSGTHWKYNFLKKVVFCLFERHSYREWDGGLLCAGFLPKSPQQPEIVRPKPGAPSRIVRAQALGQCLAAFPSTFVGKGVGSEVEQLSFNPAVL